MLNRVGELQRLFHIEMFFEGGSEGIDGFGQGFAFVLGFDIGAGVKISVGQSGDSLDDVFEGAGKGAGAEEGGGDDSGGDDQNEREGGGNLFLDAGPKIFLNVLGITNDGGPRDANNEGSRVPGGWGEGKEAWFSGERQFSDPGFSLLDLFDDFLENGLVLEGDGFDFWIDDPCGLEAGLILACEDFEDAGHLVVPADEDDRDGLLPMGWKESGIDDSAGMDIDAGAADHFSGIVEERNENGQDEVVVIEGLLGDGPLRMVCGLGGKPDTGFGIEGGLPAEILCGRGKEETGESGGVLAEDEGMGFASHEIEAGETLGKERNFGE